MTDCQTKLLTKVVIALISYVLYENKTSATVGQAEELRPHLKNKHFGSTPQLGIHFDVC